MMRTEKKVLEFKVKGMTGTMLIVSALSGMLGLIYGAAIGKKLATEEKGE